MLYQWRKFQYHTFFPSQDIKHNMSLSFSYTVDDIINFKIYLGSTSKGTADKEKMRGRRKYKKLEYLENEKSFLDIKKNIFHSS